MRKRLLSVVAGILTLAACTTTDYSSNAAGAAGYAAVAVKDFVSLGIVTVKTTEIHYCSPFGFKKRIEGSKITFADLMQEAARLEADDIINVRVDMNANYTKGAFDWLIGWSRTYTYTGTALAIKYTDKVDSAAVDPHLSSIPRMPEPSGVNKKTTREKRK